MNRKPLEGTKQGDWLILSYIKNDGKKAGTIAAAYAAEKKSR